MHLKHGSSWLRQRCMMFMMFISSSSASPGASHVAAAGRIEMLPDSVIVNSRSYNHEDVPDGVSERYKAVTLEENHAQAVKDSAH